MPPSQTFMKTPAVKLPLLNADMTHIQFGKFEKDWNVFKRFTNTPENQIHAQLYSSCDNYVRNSSVNSVTNFFTFNEKLLL